MTIEPWQGSSDQAKFLAQPTPLEQRWIDAHEDSNVQDARNYLDYEDVYGICGCCGVDFQSEEN